MGKGWIAVDLDGTLAFYDYWRGPEHIGEPISGMVNFVKDLIAEGKTVKIFTARVSDGSDMPVSRKVQIIQDWTEEHVGQRLEVTCVKDWAMEVLYDDRAVQVEINTGKRVLLNASTRLLGWSNC